MSIISISRSYTIGFPCSPEGCHARDGQQLHQLSLQEWRLDTQDSGPGCGRDGLRLLARLHEAGSHVLQCGSSKIRYPSENAYDRPYCVLDVRPSRHPGLPVDSESFNLVRTDAGRLHRQTLATFAEGLSEACQTFIAHVATRTLEYGIRI